MSSVALLPLGQFRRPNLWLGLLLLEQRNLVPERLNLLALLMNDLPQRAVLLLERGDLREQNLVCGWR